MYKVDIGIDGIRIVPHHDLEAKPGIVISAWDTLCYNYDTAITTWLAAIMKCFLMKLENLICTIDNALVGGSAATAGYSSIMPERTRIEIKLAF